MHSHDSPQTTVLDGWLAFEVLVAVLLVAAAAGYAWALWAGRHRSGRPLLRALMFYAGLVCAGVSLVGPLPQAAHGSFTAHMVGHLLLGMIAPLLLVLSTPVSVLLRGLPVRRARAVSRILRSPYVRVITHPVVAALLNAGGLWVLYTTPLFHAMHDSVWLHALVHTHIFLAGYVFTASVVGVDPDPHRATFRLRAGVLIAFIAAHSILAKWLYAHPPMGVEAADAQVGAQLTYYGGDAVDVLLIVLLFAGWYRATKPRTTTSVGMGAARP
ncbi:cytochrome c oxidase assembly protein [Kocuria sp.]|uniref:cytochrome c oxidase assembly protein n=1 Tax=Kocuria sp. TaxID=1871328 RepID=UPI00289B4DD0|nr:cytochrome c oxidase assembly protein [Kocuria sp.]